MSWVNLHLYFRGQSFPSIQKKRKFLRISKPERFRVRPWTSDLTKHYPQRHTWSVCPEATLSLATSCNFLCYSCDLIFLLTYLTR